MRLLFVLALVTFVIARKITYKNYKVFRLFPKTQEQIALLHRMKKFPNDFSSWNGLSYVNKSVDLMVAPSNHKEFIDLITLTGMKYELNIENVQHLIDTEIPKKLKKSISSGEVYHTLEEIYEKLEHLAKNYSNVMKTIDPGETFEGRVIKGAKISYKEGNPGIFIEAGIHPEEWISPATAMNLLLKLLTSKDKNIRDLAEKHDWYIFPVFNPDGYVYTHTHNRLWGKTRSNKNGPCIGVNPSRNWDFRWNTKGSSDDPCSKFYAGPAPFSEPETRSMAKYIQSIGNKLFAYISFHSYGQILMFPYGYTEAHLDNYDEELSIAQKAIKALSQKYGTKYTTGNTAETGFISSGSSTDWVKATLKLPLVFCYELRDTGKYGHLLPADQIIPNSEEIMDSFLAMFQEAAKLGYPDRG